MITALRLFRGRPSRRAVALALAAVLGTVGLLATPSRSAAASPPTTSGAYPISDPVYQVPPGGRDAGDVAAGDGLFLVVWTDYRTFETGDHSEIYGARVAADGTLLDPAGIRISSSPGAQYAPRATWSGDAFLVVWTDTRNSSNGNAGTDIYGARVTAGGKVLDPDGVPISSAAGNQWDADAVWNGSAFVVAWTADGAGGSDIWVVRLTPQLANVGPNPMFFAAASYEQSRVSLTVDGTTAVAVYTDYRDEDEGQGSNVYMNLLSINGEMHDNGFPIATGPGDQVAGGVAASTSGVLVTWSSARDGTAGAAPRVRGQRVNGTALAGPVVEISGDGTGPTAEWGPDGYLVVWRELDAESDADAIARLVSVDGVAGDPFAVTSGAESEDVAAVAADESGYLVTASKKDYTGGAGLDVLAVRVTDATPRDDPPLHVATAAREQQAPSLIRAGSDWVAAWSEYDVQTGWVIRMGRADDTGTRIDGAGTTVAAGTRDQRFPVLAWNGSRLLVVWHEPDGDSGRVMARPMLRDGTPAGPAVELGQRVADHRPSVASNGSGFVVGWAEVVVGSVYEMRAQAFDTTGTPTGTSYVLASPAYRPAVALAPLGDGYLSAWSTGRIEARRLDASGGPIDTSPIVISDSGTELSEDAPSLASSGEQALVAWIQRPGNDVQAVRVDVGGSILDEAPLLLSAEGFPVDEATAGWNGATYLVAWWRPDGKGSLMGSEVNRRGEVVVTLAAVTTLAEVPSRAPGGGAPLLASGTGGRVAVGYSALDLGPPGGGVHRGYVRFVDVDRPPPTGMSLVVDGGAASTRTSGVTLDVPATNATHVALSNNGTTWTTRTYAASQPWTLTSTNGTKTVWAKWRDAAGNWSAPKTDTIVLDTVAPAATSPSRSFPSGSALSSGRLPVKFTWSGSDAASGVARYELSRQVDGGSWSSLTSVTGTSSTPTLSPSHTYRFRVRAIDRAGNTGGWAYGPTFRMSGYSESSSTVRYSGSWGTATWSTYWGGTVRASTIPGSRAMLTFTGRSVAWITTKATNRGKAAIYVNGAYLTTVDLYASSSQTQRVVWTRNWSVSATRTMEIRVLGTSGRPRVDVDGFFVGS